MPIRTALVASVIRTAVVATDVRDADDASCGGRVRAPPLGVVKLDSVVRLFRCKSQLVFVLLCTSCIRHLRQM